MLLIRSDSDVLYVIYLVLEQFIPYKNLQSFRVLLNSNLTKQPFLKLRFREKGLVSGSMSCENANWDHYVSSEKVNANFRGIWCSNFSLDPFIHCMKAICDDILQTSRQHFLRNELKSTWDKMYFIQNVQRRSYLHKLVWVNLMKIINKSIFQCKNTKSSFISIGNLIQSTKWCVFLKTLTVAFT